MKVCATKGPPATKVAPLLLGRSLIAQCPALEKQIIWPGGSPCSEGASYALVGEAEKREGQECFPLQGELGISHGIRLIYKDGQMFTFVLAQA